MVLFFNNLLNVPLKLKGRSDFSRITISRGQFDLYIAIIIYVLRRWPLVILGFYHSCPCYKN